MQYFKFLPAKPAKISLIVYNFLTVHQGLIKLLYMFIPHYFASTYNILNFCLETYQDSIFVHSFLTVHQILIKLVYMFILNYFAPTCNILNFYLQNLKGYHFLLFLLNYSLDLYKTYIYAHFELFCIQMQYTKFLSEKATEILFFAYNC